MIKSMDRVLIFELNWMGDIIFSLPLIKALRATRPDMYIACVVVPRYAELLAENPWINYLHVLSDNNGLRSLGEKMSFVAMIKREKFDTCFLLKPSRTKAVMASLAGIGRRISFSGKNMPVTEEVELPSGAVHRVDQIMALGIAVGIERANTTYEYPLRDNDRQRAQELLRENGCGLKRLVAINPGGNWDLKRWPIERFVDLAGKLVGRFPDVELVVTGSPKDRVLAEKIVSACPDGRCHDLAGNTRVKELAGVFDKCALVISADSGPLHLASAVGADTVSIFGPTSYEITGPRGKGRNTVVYRPHGCEVPCYEEICDREHRCMRMVTADDVMNAAEDILK